MAGRKELALGPIGRIGSETTKKSRRRRRSEEELGWRDRESSKAEGYEQKKAFRTGDAAVFAATLAFPAFKKRSFNRGKPGGLGDRISRGGDNKNKLCNI